MKLVCRAMKLVHKLRPTVKVLLPTAFDHFQQLVFHLEAGYAGSFSEADAVLPFARPPFTALAIPYSMSPLANALCIRSIVTISLITRYQTKGPLKTTIQGSHTPTQFECRQVGRV